MKTRFLILIILFASCNSANRIRYVNAYNCNFEFIELNSDFEFVLTEFYKNNASCATEGIPYTLLIGKTNDEKLPKKISILSLCDNNIYSIGTKFMIKPIINPMKNTSLHPILQVKDTVINKVKYRKVIGCENKAVWGIPKQK